MPARRLAQPPRRSAPRWGSHGEACALWSCSEPRARPNGQVTVSVFAVKARQAPVAWISPMAATAASISSSRV